MLGMCEGCWCNVSKVGLEGDQGRLICFSFCLHRSQSSDHLDDSSSRMSCAVVTANALLLRGNIELHEDMSFVMEEQLIERITEYIFRANPRLKDGPEEMVANEQQNLADVIQILPKLKTGEGARSFHSSTTAEVWV